MKVHWKEDEVRKVERKAVELRGVHPTMKPIALANLATQTALPEDRWRKFDAVSDMPEPLAQAVGAVVSNGAEVPEVAKLAKEVAAQRVQFPTTDIIIIYNNAREKLAPHRPEVTAVKYLPKDVMDAVLVELDALVNPAAKSVPVPLTPTQERLIKLGSAIVEALPSQKLDVSQLQRDVATVMETVRRVQSDFGPAVAVEVAKQLAAFKREVEDTVLAMLEKPAQPDNRPVAVMSVDALHTEPAPPEPPKFRVLIVDPAMSKYEEDFRRACPRAVKLDVESAGLPPHTLPRPHFFLYSRRTAAAWVKAMVQCIGKPRCVEVDGNATDFVKQLEHISKMAWFER